MNNETPIPPVTTTKYVITIVPPEVALKTYKTLRSELAAKLDLCLPVRPAGVAPKLDKIELAAMAGVINEVAQQIADAVAGAFQPLLTAAQEECNQYVKWHDAECNRTEELARELAEVKTDAVCKTETIEHLEADLRELDAVIKFDKGLHAGLNQVVQTLQDELAAEQARLGRARQTIAVLRDSVEGRRRSSIPKVDSDLPNYRDF